MLCPIFTKLALRQFSELNKCCLLKICTKKIVNSWFLFLLKFSQNSLKWANYLKLIKIVCSVYIRKLYQILKSTWEQAFPFLRNKKRLLQTLSFNFYFFSIPLTISHFKEIRFDSTVLMEIKKEFLIFSWKRFQLLNNSFESF